LRGASFEAIATGKLFAMVKAGSLGATIFYLKAKCGWRDSDPPGGGVNVNVNGGAAAGDTIEAAKARAAQRRELLKLLTVDERRLYLNLLRVAAERQQEIMAGKAKPQVPATIETTAVRVEPGDGQ